MIIAELQKVQGTNDGTYGHIFEDVRMILRLFFPLESVVWSSWNEHGCSSASKVKFDT